MARTDSPHSATAQFFINLDDNEFLDHTATTNAGWGYPAFGTVTAGIDVVNMIACSRTATVKGHEDVPSEAIIIKKVVI